MVIGPHIATEGFRVLVPTVSSDLTFCCSMPFSRHGNLSLACLLSCLLRRTTQLISLGSVWPSLFVLGNPALFFLFLPFNLEGSFPGLKEI